MHLTKCSPDHGAPQGALYIGRAMGGRRKLRASPLANRYDAETHDDPIEMYRRWLTCEVLQRRSAFDALQTLSGQETLACWCVQRPAALVRRGLALPEQLCHFGHQLIDGLDQQGPVTLGQLLVGVLGEGAAAQLPRAVTVLDDQARLDFLFERKAGQLVRRDGALEIRDGLADQQRLLLPVVTEELPRAEAAEDLKWSIRSHA